MLFSIGFIHNKCLNQVKNAHIHTYTIHEHRSNEEQRYMHAKCRIRCIVNGIAMYTYIYVSYTHSKTCLSIFHLWKFSTVSKLTSNNDSSDDDDYSGVVVATTTAAIKPTNEFFFDFSRSKCLVERGTNTNEGGGKTLIA